MNKLVLTKEELMRAAEVKYRRNDGSIFFDPVKDCEEVDKKLRLECVSAGISGELMSEYFIWFESIGNGMYECAHKKIETVYINDNTIGFSASPNYKAIERKEVDELEDNETDDLDFEPVSSILIDVYNMLYVNKLDTDEVRKYLDYIDERN